MEKMRRLQKLLKHRDHVDDDVIYEIVERLPIKALLRFKSVCKPWKKMIEDPNFALKQLRRPTHEYKDMKLLIVHYSMPGTKEFTAVFSKETIEIATPENQEYELDCDCNGLYLFCHVTDRSLPLSLLNPVTRETIQLPHASTSAHLESKHSIREVHGLGFDVGNAVFKVIRFTMDIDFVCRKPEMLILGQKSWKQLELPACLQGIPHGGTVFLNGAIHCLFRTRPDGHHDILVAFDIMKEEFKSIKLPNISIACCHLMNVGGSLAMLLRLNGAAPETCSVVYLLKDYNKGEWCVECDYYVIKSAANKNKNQFAVIGNQLILSNFESHLFLDMETRQRIAEAMKVQKAKVSPILVNASINQLTLLPLSQYRTSN